MPHAARCPTPECGVTLAASGMDAAVSRTDTGWRVTLVHAADRARAEALLAANCGAIPYEISIGGAP